MASQKQGGTGWMTLVARLMRYQPGWGAREPASGTPSPSGCVVPMQRLCSTGGHRRIAAAARQPQGQWGLAPPARLPQGDQYTGPARPKRLPRRQARTLAGQPLRIDNAPGCFSVTGNPCHVFRHT